jgi:hypothetical protein
MANLNVTVSDGQPIAFPIDLNNAETICPHCGKATTLIVPRMRAVTPDPASSNYAASGATNNSAYGELGAGYLTAIFMPLIGFIIGIILLAKNRP